jgi:hypothetical protein
MSLEIDRDRKARWLKVYQETYVTFLAEDYDVVSSNPRPIPFSRPDICPANQIVCETELPYQELVGSLLWCIKTRPDVSFHVSFLCRYMGRYNKQLFDLALKLLSYLYHTRDHGIVFDCSGFPPGGEIKMEFFVDADWGGRIEDSKSTTGWLMRLAGVSVMTASKIQKRPALSTAEAEWNGMETACREIEWFKGFLDELGIKICLPVSVWEDNAAAIKLSKDPVNASRTKYYRIAQDYVRWCTNSGLIATSHLASADHPCDLLNKFMSKLSIQKHIAGLMGIQGKAVVNLARWKQCSRKAPRRMRLLGSRFASKSSHDPPLVARCNQCRCWFPWSVPRDGWLSCSERQVACDNDEDFTVHCFRCDRLAEDLPVLDSWYCLVCSPAAGKTLRANRRRPRRYGQSKE